MKQITIALFLSSLITVSQAQNSGQKVYAPDASSEDNFGCSVSLSKEYALIGAMGADNDVNEDNQTGVAYIFKREENGWIFHQKLSEPELDTYDDFGFTVDISENYAVIGAPLTYSGGSAFVYKRTGEQWERQLILPEYNRSNFGTSVSIDEHQLVVGAPDARGLGPSWSDQGAAWVFARSVIDGEETWSEVAMIAASDGYENGHFGCDVDISGSYIIAGAWTASADYFGRSAAYIYENEDGNWMEDQRLFPNNMDTTTNHFGKSVSISGTIAAVGAPKEVNEHLATGAVYIFEKGSTGWEETAKLVSPDPDTSVFGEFGRSVDLLDQRLLVGAHRAVFVYEKIGQTWHLADSIHHDYHNNGQAYHNYGTSISLSDSTFLVGALDDNDQASYAGAAHFYGIRLSPATVISLENTTEEILAYPNPVRSTLMIKSRTGLKQILICDSNGKWLRTLRVSQSNTFTREIDFSVFERGMYVVGIVDQDNNLEAVKVMKY